MVVEEKTHTLTDIHADTHVDTQAVLAISDKTRQDTTRHETHHTIPDHTRPYQTRKDKTRQGKARQERREK